MIQYRSLQQVTSGNEQVWWWCLTFMSHLNGWVFTWGKLTLFPFGCALGIESQIGNAAMTYVWFKLQHHCFLRIRLGGIIMYNQGSVFSFRNLQLLNALPTDLHFCTLVSGLGSWRHIHLPAGCDGSFAAFQGWRLWGLCALGPKGKGEVQWADTQCPGQMVYGMLWMFLASEDFGRTWGLPKMIWAQSHFPTLHIFATLF